MQIDADHEGEDGFNHEGDSAEIVKMRLDHDGVDWTISIMRA